MLSACLAMLMVATPVAWAQSDETGDWLGSGWVQVLDEGGQLAGNPEQGFVVIGGNDFDDPVTDAFYSADGSTWEQISIDTPTGDPWGVMDVEVGPAGFVAVSVSGGDQGGNGFVAFSADGRTWETQQPRMFHTVVAGPGGYIAESGSPTACPATTTLTVSADGRDWAVIPDATGGCSEIALDSDDDGWHLFGSRGEGVRVATSADGLEWVDLEASGTPGAEPLRGGFTLGVLGDVWAVSASTDELPGPHPGLWVSSDDGITWTTPEITTVGDVIEGDYQPWGWTVTDAGFIGYGLIEDLTDADRGFVLYSPGGDEWHQYVIDGCCQDIVANGDGLLGASIGGGVYAWSPDATLAATGSGTRTMVEVALLMVVGGAAAVLIGGRIGRPAVVRQPIGGVRRRRVVGPTQPDG